MAAVSSLGPEIFGPQTLEGNKNRCQWTEEDTILLIEMVEKMTDTIGNVQHNRAWSEVARLGKRKRRSSEDCKRKFVELWVMYEMVVNHGCVMPLSFTEKVFKRMTHYCEGDGPVDPEKPKRTVPVHCVKECVKNLSLLRLLGIDTPEELEEVGSKRSTTDEFPYHRELRGTKTVSPHFSNSRRSERVAKKLMSSSEGRGSTSGSEEQDGGLPQGPRIFKCYRRKSQQVH